jgi:hypothetical protein
MLAFLWRESTEERFCQNIPPTKSKKALVLVDPSEARRKVSNYFTLRQVFNFVFDTFDVSSKGCKFFSLVRRYFYHFFYQGHQIFYQGQPYFFQNLFESLPRGVASRFLGSFRRLAFWLKGDEVIAKVMRLLSYGVSLINT